MRRRPLWLALVLVTTMAWTVLPLGASAQEQDDEHPVFLTGPNEGDPEDIAVDYLRSEAEVYGLSEMDVADLTVRSSYTSRHNGVTHVNVNQRFRGREVFQADMTLNIAEDGAVVPGDVEVTVEVTGGNVGPGDLDLDEVLDEPTRAGTLAVGIRELAGDEAGTLERVPVAYRQTCTVQDPCETVTFDLELPEGDHQLTVEFLRGDGAPFGPAIRAGLELTVSADA
jgi:hypothetical protein